MITWIYVGCNPLEVIFIVSEKFSKAFNTIIVNFLLFPKNSTRLCVFDSYLGSGAQHHTLSLRIQPHHLIDALIKLIQFIDRFTIVLLYDANIGKYFCVYKDKDLTSSKLFL